jgi:hypothetical protein
MAVYYHGTLASNVESILREGLRPRGSSPSHDEYLERPSLPEFVYLTSNPVLAADHIVRVSTRRYDGASATILQIDGGLDNSLMYPDEDYLDEEWNSDFSDWTYEQQMKFVERHQREWKKSLTTMHTIAYRGTVTPELITVPETFAILLDIRRRKFAELDRMRLAARRIA